MAAGRSERADALTAAGRPALDRGCCRAVCIGWLVAAGRDMLAGGHQLSSVCRLSCPCRPVAVPGPMGLGRLAGGPLATRCLPACGRAALGAAAERCVSAGWWLLGGMRLPVVGDPAASADRVALAAAPSAPTSLAGSRPRAPVPSGARPGSVRPPSCPRRPAAVLKPTGLGRLAGSRLATRCPPACGRAAFARRSVCGDQPLPPDQLAPTDSPVAPRDPVPSGVRSSSVRRSPRPGVDLPLSPGRPASVDSPVAAPRPGTLRRAVVPHPPAAPSASPARTGPRSPARFFRGAGLY